MVPPQANLSKEGFAKLQQHWYAKLIDADPDWQDIEWVDHTTGQGHNSPHLRGSLFNGKVYHPGRALYYDLALNYLQHCGGLRGYRRFIWKLHAHGETYDHIMDELQRNYKNAPSKYTVYYDIEDIAKLCFKWNCVAEEGLIRKRQEDRESFFNSPLADLYKTEYNWIIGEEEL